MEIEVGSVWHWKNPSVTVYLAHGTQVGYQDADGFTHTCEASMIRIRFAPGPDPSEAIKAENAKLRELLNKAEPQVCFALGQGQHYCYVTRGDKR